VRQYLALINAMLSSVNIFGIGGAWHRTRRPHHTRRRIPFLRSGQQACSRIPANSSRDRSAHLQSRYL
jgi:hypothetical protein